MGGDDTLSIMSFNSSRKGLYSMSRDRGSMFMDKILNGASPDICFLPGDDKTVKYSGAVQGYCEYRTCSEDGTALLYSTKTVQMNKPQFCFDSFGVFRSLDLNKLVCPQVDVLGPTNNIVKQFNLITWQYTLYGINEQIEQTKSREERLNLTESLIMFSQRLAMQTGQGVLISGEMAIDSQSLSALVKKLCKDGQDFFLSEIQPEMAKHAYLPSMTKASFRDVRHLFMMNVFKCKSSSVFNGSVNTWNEQMAECFIASKSLELSDASMVDVDEAIAGRHIKLCPSTKPVYGPPRPKTDHTCPSPIKTEMKIPPRQPRHHGG